MIPLVPKLVFRIASLVHGVRNGFGSVVSSIARHATEIMDTVHSIARAIIHGAGEKFKDFADRALGWVSTIKEYLSKFTDSAKLAAAALVGIAQRSAQAMAKWFTGVKNRLKLLPGIVAGGIQGIAEMWGDVYTAVSTSVAGAARVMKDAVASGMGTAGEMVSKVHGMAKDAVTSMWGGIKTAISLDMKGMIARAQNAISQAVAGLRSMITAPMKLLARIMTTVAEARGKFEEEVRAKQELLKSATEQTKKAAEDALASAANKLAEFDVSGSVKGMASVAAELIDQASASVLGVARAFKDALQAMESAALTAAARAASAAETAFGSATTELQTLLEPLNALLPVFQGAVKTMVDFVDERIASVADVLASTITALTDAAINFDLAEVKAWCLQRFEAVLALLPGAPAWPTFTLPGVTDPVLAGLEAVAVVMDKMSGQLGIMSTVVDGVLARGDWVWDALDATWFPTDQSRTVQVMWGLLNIPKDADENIARIARSFLGRMQSFVAAAVDSFSSVVSNVRVSWRIQQFMAAISDRSPSTLVQALEAVYVAYVVSHIDASMVGTFFITTLVSLLSHAVAACKAGAGCLALTKGLAKIIHMFGKALLTALVELLATLKTVFDATELAFAGSTVAGAIKAAYNGATALAITALAALQVALDRVAGEIIAAATLAQDAWNGFKARLVAPLQDLFSGWDLADTAYKGLNGFFTSATTLVATGGHAVGVLGDVVFAVTSKVIHVGAVCLSRTTFRHACLYISRALTPVCARASLRLTLSLRRT